MKGGTTSSNQNTLSYTTPPSRGGQFRFTLANSGSTGAPLFDLFLSIPLDLGNIDTATSGTPVGWGDPTGGLLFFGSNVTPATSFIQWAAAFTGLYDLPVGGSLSGFDSQEGLALTKLSLGSTHQSQESERHLGAFVRFDVH